MTAPATENERLAARLASIATALNPPPQANGHASFTEEVVVALAAPIAKFVKERIAEAVAPLEQRLVALEKRKGLAPLAARLAHLEERSLTYEGVWSETKAYNRGAFCTFQGSLWFCEDTNCGVRPGAGSSAWKLAVKRGKGG